MTPAERAFDLLEARLTAEVSERMVELSEARPGARVLDLACGTGEPALRLARVVGPTGHVLGVDLDAGRVELARQAAPSWCEFRCGDVARLQAEGPFDAVTSRWGLSYVRDVGGALASVRGVLAPGAPLVVALWAGPAEVPWAALPRRVTERFVSMPAPPSIARFGDVRDFTQLLVRAGFDVTHLEAHEVSVVEADDADGLVEWVEVVLSGLAALVPVHRRADWRRALRDELGGARTGARYRLGGVTRVVVAR